MIYVIIALIFFFFVLPLIARLMLPWLLKRQAKRMAKEFARRAGAAGNPFDGPFGAPFGAQGGEDEQPARPAKIIDPNVGEYVRFEEIEVTETTKTTATDKKSYKVEEQVVDVEWEDIPSDSK